MIFKGLIHESFVYNKSEMDRLRKDFDAAAGTDYGKE